MKGKASLGGSAGAETHFHLLCLDVMVVSVDAIWTLWPDYAALVLR